MGIVIKSFFRFGVLLTAAGVICAFVMTNDVILGYALLGCIILYLIQAIWTANRPTEYNTFKERFEDILGDITAYTLLLVVIFAWFVSSRVVTMPINDFRYWVVVSFLVAMCIITLFEMIMTIRSCLKSLDRPTPVIIDPHH